MEGKLEENDRAGRVRIDPDYYFKPSPEGRAKNIAFVTGMIRPFVASVYHGLEQQAYKTAKHSFIISHFSTLNEEQVKNEVLAKFIFEKNIDCLVMMTDWPAADFMAEFKKQRVPVITIEKKIPGAHSITVDNFKGGYDAASYLAKNNRKKIALIRGEAGLLKGGEVTDQVPKDRQGGYMAALADNGINFDQNLVYTVYHHNREEGAEVFAKMQKDRADIDAVFSAAGDLTALGFMEAAQKAGVKVPEDMAVIGFDDIEQARGCGTGLTTIRQPAIEMGAEAFMIAEQAIKGGLRDFKHTVFMPELVKRGTA